MSNVIVTVVMIAKWMSACGKAVIVKATKGEYVDGLCQPYRLHLCRVRSPDVVSRGGPGLAMKNLWCLPPPSPCADYTAHGWRVARLIELKLPTDPKVGYQHPVHA